MTDDHDAPVDARAWAEFCATLEAAGQKILDHAEDDLDRAEGFRYLARLTRGGLENFIEHGDTEFPTVPVLPHMLKIGCDNPDALYQRVTIDPAHTYRLHGPRGTVNYLGIGAYSGGYAAGDATPGRQGYLEFNAPDGPDEHLDIHVGPTAPADGRPWLETASDTTLVIVRNFFLDRTAERPSDLAIECLTRGQEHPSPLAPDRIAGGLAMAGLFVHGVVDMFNAWVEDLFKARPNTLDFLPPDDAANGWGDPNQLFRHGYWRLDHDEALEITFTPPECRYWNFQVNNIWEESLDYRYLPVTVNAHTARSEDDGSVRIVVAHEDPGLPNWMTTHGHRHGTMGLRWNQAVGDVAPSCQVVPVARLRSSS